MKIEISFSPYKKISTRVIDNKTKMFIGNECGKLMEKYWAFDRGVLSQTYKVAPDHIAYTQKYAAPMYYGAIRGTKVNYNREIHPLATSYPDRAMMTAEKDKLCRAITEYLKRR